MANVVEFGNNICGQTNSSLISPLTDASYSNGINRKSHQRRRRRRHFSYPRYRVLNKDSTLGTTARRQQRSKQIRNQAIAAYPVTCKASFSAVYWMKMPRVTVSLQ